MISLTMSATDSRSTAACSAAITLLAASRAVMLFASAIVMSPSSNCWNRTTIMSTAVA